MRRVLLAVDGRDAVVPAEGDQRRQRDLRRIAHAREHRFAKHRLADGHAIQAAGELAVDPCLNAVRHAGAMQRNIGLHHLRHDPGAVLAFAWAGRAGPDDLGEGGVKAHLAADAALEKMFQRLAQRAV